MKRLLVGLALVLFPLVALSQMTATLTTYNESPKEFVARGLSGDPIATPYIAGQPDTFQLMTVVGQAIDSVYWKSMPATVFQFNVVRGDRNNVEYIYYDTLNNNVQHIVPKAESLGIADSMFYFVVNDSIANGEKFSLEIREILEVRLSGDTLTVNPVFTTGADSLNTY